VTSFDDALKVWAKTYLEDQYGYTDVVVNEAQVYYWSETGYCPSCHEDENLDITIKFVTSDGESRSKYTSEYDKATISQFQLLQELFKQEEGE
jgi:hypothetical protein